MKADFMKQTILGQPSFVMRSRNVELAVTETGGHMAPVTFGIDTDTPHMPYFISPWQLEGLEPEHSYLDVFRGDFFCLPFGLGGPGFPLHGETAGLKWELVSAHGGTGRPL